MKRMFILLLCVSGCVTTTYKRQQFVQRCVLAQPERTCVLMVLEKYPVTKEKK